MIAGALQLEGFGYAIADTEGRKIIDGKPAGDAFPLKVLAIADPNSGLRISLLFTPEEFEAFGEKMRGDIISRATIEPQHHIMRNLKFNGR